ncbi:hypothetical protein B0O99DRAFT_613294 [Bisporella sp. PMI_857]|nr:hypothetical protein B0O99DRAFT_613294 [Bisporella sp. PMI_857]
MEGMKAAQHLALRTVHIKMYPTARTFQERREVLRVIERFGEVNMFKSLKYHPITPVHDSFIALFSSKAAAENLINTSPIRYRLMQEGESMASTSSIASQELASREATETSETSAECASDPIVVSDSKPASTTADRVFELSVSKSHFDHQRYIIEQPTTGPWKPVAPRLSFMNSTLTETVPLSLMTAGLADWETSEEKYRTSDVKEQVEMYKGSQPVGKHLGTAWKRNEERRRQFERKEMPRVMKSLSELNKKARRQEV